ncbi:hypothetical protein EAE96_001206 [Botrytis aclada]|nr:hypothetical protein EAE96_001206 [Botrytis aclada]
MHISHPEFFRYHQSPTHSPKAYHVGQVPAGAVLHIASTSAFDSAVFTLYEMLHTFLWRTIRSKVSPRVQNSNLNIIELIKRSDREESLFEQMKDTTPGAYGIDSQMNGTPFIDQCPMILSKVWKMSFLSIFKCCISAEILQLSGLRTGSLTTAL